MKTDALTPLEKRTAISLSLVFALRMLGLFMIMPVFAVYGKDLIGYSIIGIMLDLRTFDLPVSGHVSEASV